MEALHGIHGEQMTDEDWHTMDPRDRLSFQLVTSGQMGRITTLLAMLGHHKVVEEIDRRAATVKARLGK